MLGLLMVLMCCKCKWYFLNVHLESFTATIQRYYLFLFKYVLKQTKKKQICRQCIKQMLRTFYLNPIKITLKVRKGLNIFQAPNFKFPLTHFN